jgi:hypothetical protein
MTIPQITLLRDAAAILRDKHGRPATLIDDRSGSYVQYVTPDRKTYFTFGIEDWLLAGERVDVDGLDYEAGRIAIAPTLDFCVGDEITGGQIADAIATAIDNSLAVTA